MLFFFRPPKGSDFKEKSWPGYVNICKLYHHILFHNIPQWYLIRLYQDNIPSVPMFNKCSKTSPATPHLRIAPREPTYGRPCKSAAGSSQRPVEIVLLFTEGPRHAARDKTWYNWENKKKQLNPFWVSWAQVGCFSLIETIMKSICLGPWCVEVRMA